MKFRHKIYIYSNNKLIPMSEDDEQNIQINNLNKQKHKPPSRKNIIFNVFVDGKFMKSIKMRSLKV